MNIFSHVTGNTLGIHHEFLRKLTNRGAKVVDLIDKAKAIIVICPLVSRYETDILSALSSIPESKCETVILVVMHHTFNKDQILPRHRDLGSRALALHVDCLFHEQLGLLKCPCNDNAIKMVCKQLKLKGKFFSCVLPGSNKK
ncbi:Polycystin-1 [Dissostichus eleginoides]|uniref:Polycystin-1 n=1 Tax=Dissostichus eleginoides TaxID=100907 RepID=A0AAD9EUL1_DISEL|nr:Polycystin-1 [Dissostichus eleginoides]